MGLFFLPFPAKTVDISRGEFVCPKCQARTTYRHREVLRRVLVMCVYPLVTDRLRDYIECVACQTRFDTTLLRQTSMAESTREIIAGITDQITAGQPIEEAEARLAFAGMDVSTIKQYLSLAAGIGRRRCESCELTYRKNVLNCRRCSHRLPEPPRLTGT